MGEVGSGEGCGEDLTKNDSCLRVCVRRLSRVECVCDQMQKSVRKVTRKKGRNEENRLKVSDEKTNANFRHEIESDEDEREDLREERGGGGEITGNGVQRCPINSNR